MADSSAGALKTFKIDASAEGCSGMYWRKSCSLNDTSSDASWPRNGATHKGVVIEPGWVRFENGFFLPTHQAGFQILFEQ